MQKVVKTLNMSLSGQVQKLKYISNRLSAPVWVSSISVIFSILLMFFFLAGDGRGNLAWHVRPAAYFGITEVLRNHNVEPWYVGAGNVGWDGQFYFAIANDLKMSEDTAQHMDTAVTYRYQRIGLPLAANVVALLTLQKWVSPLVYWGTNLALLFWGTFALASILKRRGLSPGWALFWSLSAGVQVTVLSGLPDAAGDAFFLIAIDSLLRRRYPLYSLAAIMAILSRESFVFAAAGIFLAYTYVHRADLMKWAVSLYTKLFLLALPGVVFVGWQLSIFMRFGKLPSQEPGVAGAIFSAPFLAWYEALQRAVTDGSAFFARSLANSQVALGPTIVLLLGAFTASLYLIHKNNGKVSDNLMLIGAAFLPLPLLAATFGPVVTMHWTGYSKATAILIVPVMLAFSKSKIQTRNTLGIILCLYLVIQMPGLWAWTRTDGAANEYSSEEIFWGHKESSFPKEVSCLREYKSKINLLRFENFDRSNLFRAIAGLPSRYLLELQVENLGAEKWQHTQGKGNVNIAGRWMDGRSRLEIGRTRLSVIGGEIGPGERRNLHMVIEGAPPRPGAKLILSMVQEGCGWFDAVGDVGFVDMGTFR
ncbi:hypothetical protein [Agrobacterium tumefaciens]|uniref:hypothetical protein n=1 Tax=Agrobacterium tumefaciens TaxID=358 RepID=UPI001572480F|nr:hypothetical protein [Agrobacterium tumefaciens]WCJ64409.1 hypothetical protein G6M15_16010 [Agrobacterium tumefaciens]